MYLQVRRVVKGKSLRAFYKGRRAKKRIYKQKKVSK